MEVFICVIGKKEEILRLIFAGHHLWQSSHPGPLFLCQATLPNTEARIIKLLFTNLRMEILTELGISHGVEVTTEAFPKALANNQTIRSRK